MDAISNKNQRQPRGDAVATAKDAASAAIDSKKLNAIEKKIRAQLEALLQLARKAGVKNPMLFIEGEGGLYVMDRDHPAYDAAHRLSGVDRQKAVIARLGSALPLGTDCGAW